MQTSSDYVAIKRCITIPNQVAATHQQRSAITFVVKSENFVEKYRFSIYNYLVTAIVYSWRVRLLWRAVDRCERTQPCRIKSKEEITIRGMFILRVWNVYIFITNYKDKGRVRFTVQTLIALIVRAYVRRNLNYGVSERENVCVGGARRYENRRERKEAQRDAKRRWLFIGCARFRSLPSKGSLSFALPVRPFGSRKDKKEEEEEKKRKDGKEDLWRIFIIPRHYSFDAPLYRGGNRCTLCSLSRLAPLFFPLPSVSRDLLSFICYLQEFKKMDKENEMEFLFDLALYDDRVIE